MSKLTDTRSALREIKLAIAGIRGAKINFHQLPTVQTALLSYERYLIRTEGDEPQVHAVAGDPIVGGLFDGEILHEWGGAEDRLGLDNGIDFRMAKKDWGGSWGSLYNPEFDRYSNITQLDLGIVSLPRLIADAARNFSPWMWNLDGIAPRCPDDVTRVLIYTKDMDPKVDMPFVESRNGIKEWRWIQEGAGDDICCYCFYYGEIVG